MRLARTLRHKISSEDVDGRMGQLACWTAAILVPALGFLKLATLPVTETELFFGLLLVLSVALLCVNLGMLIRIDTKRWHRGND